MQYIIVEAASADELARQVTRSLCDGWQLYGSLAVAVVGSGNSSFFQPMTRRQGKEPERGEDFVGKA
jgi:hypothetical protein